MTGVQRIRVVIVDDQRLFVHGLSLLFESQPDLELVGTAADGREALHVIASSRPDVVLMDLRMPVMGGIESMLRLRDDPALVGNTRPRIVILTTFRQREAVIQSLRSGAAGFLTKDAAPEEVLETVRSVHRGDAIPETLRRHLDSHARGLKAASRPTREELLGALSPREREILLLVAKGLSNSEIAASAFVSETTVKTHISRILAKLDLRSRAQVIVLAHESGLVSR